MPKTCLLFLLGLLSLGLVPYISSEQMNTGSVAFAEDATPREALRIVVPQNVKDHWKSVDISVLDQKINAETSHTIAIGQAYVVPDTSISLKVVSFLPAFIMNGTQITSASNELQNPAVYVIIKDSDRIVFSGWLFSQYPDAHAFKNPRFSFNLTGYHQK